MAQARAGLVPRAATSMPETSVIHPDDVARRTLQCIHPACNRDAHPDARFAADPSEPLRRFCCGACKKTFEAGTITKSSNHGPLCTSGPAGQGLNRAGAAPTEPRPEQSRSSARTRLNKASTEQQQMAQRRAEQQQQQMAQASRELPTRSRSRSAVRSSSAKGLANPEMRIRVTPSDVKTTLNLDVTASDTIEIVKDMIQTELTERLTDRDMSVTHRHPGETDTPVQRRT